MRMGELTSRRPRSETTGGGTTRPSPSLPLLTPPTRGRSEGISPSHTPLRITFAQVSRQPPDEVGAVVAEGGLGEGHPLEAVPGRAPTRRRCRLLRRRGRRLLLSLLPRRGRLSGQRAAFAASPQQGAGKRAGAAAAAQQGTGSVCHAAAAAGVRGAQKVPLRNLDLRLPGPP